MLCLDIPWLGCSYLVKKNKDQGSKPSILSFHQEKCPPTWSMRHQGKILLLPKAPSSGAAAVAALRVLPLFPAPRKAVQVLTFFHQGNSEEGGPGSCWSHIAVCDLAALGLTETSCYFFVLGWTLPGAYCFTLFK